MPQTRANGKDRSSIAAAVGSLHVQKTELLELGTIWIELLIPNPSNQTFRARAVQMKDKLDALKDVSVDNLSAFVDEDGQFTDDVIALIHTIYIEDWGGYDDKGKRVPLYDADGDPVPCTLEEFSSVVRDMDGGSELFMAIQQHVAKLNAGKIQVASAEKNSSEVSPTPRASAPSRRTRKGPRRARA